MSTKQGVLGDYNLITKKFDKEISNPVWNVRKYPMDFWNVRSVKVDPKGNSIWFTDEKQNTIYRTKPNTMIWKITLALITAMLMLALLGYFYHVANAQC